MLPRHPLFRLLAINGLLGVALAGIVVGTVIWFDVGQIGHLLLKDRNPAAALVILLGSFIITCASVMMGTAIMLLSRGDERPPGGRREHLVPAPALAFRRAGRRNNNS